MIARNFLVASCKPIITHSIGKFRTFETHKVGLDNESVKQPTPLLVTEMK